MESAAGQEWFLRKHENGEIFGPLAHEQLERWASTAQIAPHDSISADQENWMKAPMLAELGMDWLVEVTSERCYGPTTLGAVFEFVRSGEITAETFVINTCDGSRRQISELEPPPVPQEQSDDGSRAIADFGSSVSSADRVRELEKILAEERRALREIEERYRVLETRYRELLDQTASDGTLR
jgi:hypothetical protein